MIIRNHTPPDHFVKVHEMVFYRFDHYLCRLSLLSRNHKK